MKDEPKVMRVPVGHAYRILDKITLQLLVVKDENGRYSLAEEFREIPPF